MIYEDPLYRPPSEAKSLILQITVGCSYNRCTFCGMYKEKTFRIRTEEEINRHIESAAAFLPNASRIFLADGNVLCLPAARLLILIEQIRDRFPRLQRLSLYASPQDLLRKKPEELQLLKNAGLDLIYLGAESGSENILTNVRKGASRDEIIRSCRMIGDAGIGLSITLISGLGGKALWKEHAADSASLMNAVQPDYLSLLTLMVVPGTPLHRDLSEGSFEPLSPQNILEEFRLFVGALELNHCIFRSNHASNYLPIGGTLPADKGRILDILNQALNGKFPLRDERRRAL